MPPTADQAKAGSSIQAGKVLPPAHMANGDLQTSWLSGYQELQCRRGAVPNRELEVVLV